MFTTMITEAIKKVEDPHLENGKKTTVYDRLVKVDNCSDGGFDFGNLAADSDYVSFYQFVGKTQETYKNGKVICSSLIISILKQDYRNSPLLAPVWYFNKWMILDKLIKLEGMNNRCSFFFSTGVPSLDMYYIGDDVFPYAVYHSVYDTYQWLTRFVDPDFSYHMTTTQVAARSLMLTADSIVLPFDVRHYPKSLRRSLRELNDTYGKELYQNNVTLDYIDIAISRLALACVLPTSLHFFTN